MRAKSRWVLVAVIALLASGRPSGQPPQELQLILGADSLNPSTPTTGQTVTVTFSINSPIEFSGEVGGTFQDVSLVTPSGDTRLAVSVRPNQSFSGSLLLTVSTPTSDQLLLHLYPLPKPNCGVGLPLRARTRACRTQPIQSASIPLTIVAPTVRVRIAGVGYSDVKRPDSKDRSTASSGYQCVVHNPGCGWWGNDGVDEFFNQRSLPLGAKLESTEFVQYWPKDVDSISGGGAWTWLNSSGTYYAKNAGNDPVRPRIKWNNTCWGGFGGKELAYSISFIVSMPQGTDLGEPSADPSSNPSSNCPFTGSQPSPVTIISGGAVAPSGWLGQVQFCNASTVTITYYLHIRAKLVTAYDGAKGDANMSEDNLPLQFAPGGSAGVTATYRTSEKYKQGSWQLTDVYLTTSPTTPPDAQVKNPARLPSLPVSANLPGAPVFDFRGGTCI